MRSDASANAATLQLRRKLRCCAQLRQQVPVSVVELSVGRLDVGLEFLDIADPDDQRRHLLMAQNPPDRRAGQRRA